MYYFYLVQSPKGRMGFGITKNPKSRNQDYISHAGDIVNFPVVYGGVQNHAAELERTIKQQFINNIWLVRGWKTEWLNDTVTLEELQDYVETLIKERHIRVSLVAKDYNFTQGEINVLNLQHLKITSTY